MRSRRRRPRLDAERRRPPRRARPAAELLVAARARRAAALGRGARARSVEREHERLVGDARPRCAGAPRARCVERRRAAARARGGARLRALSPRATLERGYAIVRAGDGDRPRRRRGRTGDRARRRAGRGRLRRARWKRRGDRAADLRGGAGESSSGSSSGSSAATRASTRRSQLWQRGEELYRFCREQLDAARRARSRSWRSASRLRSGTWLGSPPMPATVEQLQHVPLFADLDAARAPLARPLVQGAHLRRRRHRRRRGHRAASASSSSTRATATVTADGEELAQARPRRLLRRARADRRGRPAPRRSLRTPT